MHPHHSLYILDHHWVLRDAIVFTIKKPLGIRDSAGVDVMTTLHRSTPFLWRHAKRCVPPEGIIAFAKDPWKSTFILLKPSWPYKMSLDPLIRIPSSYVGASVSLQGHLSHHLDPVLSPFISYWGCSEISMRLSISWITSYLVALDFFLPFDEFSMLSP